MDSKRIIVFGAHPDDCDIFAGGISIKYVREGHEVKFVSLTNGEAGHYQNTGETLAQRRREEARAAAELVGIQFEMLDFPDGELRATLDVRRQVIGLIRDWQAEIVFSHRPYDYHPDHRACGQVVCDAAYMVTVPHICPDKEALRENPYFFYMWDPFQLPYAFQTEMAVDIDDVMDTKLDMMDCHVSQFYEWLPYLAKQKDVPKELGQRKIWLRNNWGPWLSLITESCRNKLIQRYGQDKASTIRYAECFELCEYGRKPYQDDLENLFPY